ncbi:MAG: hypothetical protein NZT92_05530 [Abditibacteriales bacterium]|nr:hypothetical protein [Abditibacteriales bacterium]MDW8365578.1 hypothetical protein [Abditibacteriales bacterium]
MTSDPDISERRSEWNKAMMRLFVVILLFVVVVYLNSRTPPVMSRQRLVLLAGVSGCVALGFVAWLKWGRYHPAFKFMTAAADVALISLLVHSTGAHSSFFFPLYFIVLISNGIRYGAAMSVFVALAFNVAYVLVLTSAAPLSATLPHEGVKILAFYLAAFYVGYLATRFQRLRHEVDGYVETIAQLREELKRCHTERNEKSRCAEGDASLRSE